ncbi:periplasmic sensor hybrid histidine kinase [Candidatus Koribacter versatilis Ellin345]|uniref:histidine kinase n=1 Tax=Koribacter versatilis (strain Ellin345) TaxID=204669 RepID=Q1IKJ9_KORVE|nr:ATP-binding protein [Candidatus Koribacter versatilis]ABF42601.1 periplasmic sensor hybrid histidine kinase [Candidatus Koribacter versatilis Ellin345]
MLNRVPARSRFASWFSGQYWWRVPVATIVLLQVITLIALHLVGREIIVENCLDFGLSSIAIVVAWQASRRSRGLTRVAWMTLSLCCSFFALSLAIGIGAEVLPYTRALTELSDEISVFWLAPLSFTLFLEPDFEFRGFDPIHVLDFIQLVIFWVAVFFMFLFLPMHVFVGQTPHSWLQATWGGTLVYDLSMTMLFSLRAMLTRSRSTRRFFWRFSLFLVVGCLADLYANYNKLPSATWFQLVWTALNIAPIVLAGTWTEDETDWIDAKSKAGRVLGDQLFPVMTAFLVLILSMVIVRERLGFAVMMVSISFVCSSLRMVVVQQRELRIAADLQAEIAERRRAEQLLRENEEHLEEQVANRTSELSEANSQLRSEIIERQRLEEQLRQTQKMEAIGTLSGGIAHDFNNLLTVIRGYARMVLDRVGNDPELRTDVEQIDEAGARAAALTSQLLAFSRRQMLQPRTINLNGLVRDLQKMLQRLIGEHIELTTRAGEGLGAVKADPGQIEQVILNLVVNARDAMPRGGSLVLETRNVQVDEAFAREHVDLTPGDYVMLAVHDTGVGMDDATKVHIFEPFFTTKERARGTGLGLSMVYGIVKQSGGSIVVESQLAKGSSFKIFLPRIQARTEVETGLHPVAVGKGSEIVLLVEDDEQVRNLTLTMLRRFGYTVYVAENGTEALKFNETHSGEINLLLTDVVMPGASGPEIAVKISASRPGIKVLYMSGYTDDAIGTHGILEEGISLLQKPFTPAALGERVREVLDAVPVKA